MISILDHKYKTIPRITELVNNLRFLDSIDVESHVQFDRLGFITPLAIAPIASIINNRDLNFDFKDSVNDASTSYLRNINFPEGFSETENRTTLLNKKSDIPLLHVKMDDESEIPKKFRTLHDKYLDLIKTLIPDSQFLNNITINTFGFVLGEMLDNIEEHSIAKNAYILAQFWPSIKTCEICLLDDGQGIMNSLNKAGKNIKNSMDALERVLRNRISSKIEQGESKRGTGIDNTCSAITNKEVNGEFFILSGNAAFLNSAEHEEHYFDLQDYSWKGTIIMLRLGKPQKRFNLYDYVT